MAANSVVVLIPGGQVKTLYKLVDPEIQMSGNRLYCSHSSKFFQ